MTEKELVEKVLRDRAIVKSDNTLDKTRFEKLITEPWIRKRVETYGWLKQPICAIEKTADLSAENKPVDETPKTVEKVPQIENKAPENSELTTTVSEHVEPVVPKTAVVEETVTSETVVEEPIILNKIVDEVVIPEAVVLVEKPSEEVVEESATEEVVEEETSEEAAPKKTRKKKN